MNERACPNCGRSNPEGFRFCGACGASLQRICPSCDAPGPWESRFCGACGAPFEQAVSEPAPALEERKVVTVLFADLTASTEMAARLDPEDLRGVLRSFFDAMAEEAGRFEGTVEKYIGDAVVAVFGAPVAHEDDPERAVAAALAMHARMPALNERLSGTARGQLAMRIGLNTGEVIAAHRSDHEGYVTGEAVNIAARFQALARPGAVVVGERTYRDTRDAFAYRELGEVTVKGIDRSLRAWEVIPGARPAPELSELRSPMVGRDEEMELLRLLFSRTVKDRRPNLVTVVGPPGIGKSRLSHEFAALAGVWHSWRGGAEPEQLEREVRVVRGRCLPYGEGLTYWPMAEILKADAGILDSDPPDAIIGKARARLDPRFAGDDRGLGTTYVLLSSIGVAMASDPLAGAEPAAAQKLIVAAWRRYLESMAAEQPVIGLIEDIHWADPSMLDLIESLATRMSGPLMLLCMARPDLSERRPTWGGGLANANTIALAPLSAGEGAALLENLLDGDGPEEVVGPILERSEGNPFFAGELLRMMIEDGTIARVDGTWVQTRGLPSTLPDTVQGVIASRIDLLSPAEKRLIQDAAVVGRVFWQGAVERLGLPGAASALDTLIEKGLVQERDHSTIEGERELIFNHVLTRDVAYNGIPRARRADAHAATIDWIESVTAGREEEFAEILAYHSELAGDLVRTARYAMLAGHRHRRVFAAEEAIRWYDRARDAASQMDGPDRRSLLADILLSRGEACEQIGRFPEAHEDYEHALEHSRGAGGERLEARALASLAHVLWMRDRYEEGESVLPEALERARSSGSTDLLARLLYTAGTTSFGKADWDRALSFHEEALRVAAENGDVEGEALARHGLCETRFFCGPFEEALVQGQRADELLRELGQRPMVHHNEYMVGSILWLLGRFREALSVYDASVEGCRDVGNRRDEGFGIAQRAGVRAALGDLGGALDDIDRGVELALEVGVPRMEVANRLDRVEHLGELWAFGRMEEEVRIARSVSDALGGAFTRGPLFSYAGWLALRRGDEHTAPDLFDQGSEVAHGPLDRMRCGWAELRAWEERRDAHELDRVSVELLEVAQDASPTFAAYGHWGRALAAGLREDWSGALQLGGRALAVYPKEVDRRIAWRVGGVRARALSALGSDSEAEAAGVEAASILRSIAGSIDDEVLRASFLGRSDVAEILGPY